jgi:hypothetical protein
MFISNQRHRHLSTGCQTWLGFSLVTANDLMIVVNYLLIGSVKSCLSVRGTRSKHTTRFVLNYHHCRNSGYEKCTGSAQSRRATLLYSFRSIPLLFPSEPSRSVPSLVFTRRFFKATKNQYRAFALNRYCEYGGVETAADRIIWLKSTLLIKPKRFSLHLFHLLSVCLCRPQECILPMYM